MTGYFFQRPPDGGGGESPQGGYGTDKASRKGVAHVVFTHVHVVVVPDLQDGPYFSEGSVVVGRYNDLNVFGIVEFPVEKGESSETVTGAREEPCEIIKTPPGSQARGGDTAVKIEVGLPHHSFRSSEDSLEVLVCRPLILVEKKSLGRWITGGGIGKAVEKMVVITQFVGYVRGDDLHNAIADAIDAAQSINPQWNDEDRPGRRQASPA